MKTFREIESELIERFASLQNKVTNFVLGSVIRAILTTVAGKISEVWYDLNRIRRRLFLDTAMGEHLDALVAEVGMERKGSTTTSVVLVFNGSIESGASTDVGTNYLEDNTKSWTDDQFIDGTWILKDSNGTNYTVTGNTSIRITVNGNPASGQYYVLPVVPLDTVVRSSVSGVGFELKESVIVGDDNPELIGQTLSPFLGNRGVAESLITGSGASAGAHEINVLSPSIPGVTTVTNPFPTQPRTGIEEELDEQLRRRRRNFINLLNQGTQAFYEALAVEADIRVSRAIAKKDGSTGGVKLLIATRSGSTLESSELNSIASYVSDRARAFLTVTAVNMVMTDIFVSIDAVLRPGTSLQNLYIRTADRLANFIDYGRWDINRKLVDDELLVEIRKLRAYIDIDLSTFSVIATKDGQPAGSKNITFVDSLPRLARLRINSVDSVIVSG